MPPTVDELKERLDNDGPQSRKKVTAEVRGFAEAWDEEVQAAWTESAIVPWDRLTPQWQNYIIRFARRITAKGGGP